MQRKEKKERCYDSSRFTGSHFRTWFTSMGKFLHSLLLFWLIYNGYISDFSSRLMDGYFVKLIQFLVPGLGGAADFIYFPIPLSEDPSALTIFCFDAKSPHFVRSYCLASWFYAFHILVRISAIAYLKGFIVTWVASITKSSFGLS